SALAGRKECAAVSMFVVKRTKRFAGSLQENIEPTLRKSNLQVGNLAEDIAHRHVESTALFKGKTTQIVEKIILKTQPILICLLEKLFAAKAECVTGFPGYVRKEPT